VDRLWVLCLTAHTDVSFTFCWLASISPAVNGYLTRIMPFKPSDQASFVSGVSWLVVECRKGNKIADAVYLFT